MKLLCRSRLSTSRDIFWPCGWWICNQFDMNQIHSNCISNTEAARDGYLQNNSVADFR